MELTEKQEQGLKIAIERYNKKEKYTCISGYAGSGKSTLIKFIVNSLGLKNYQVSYIAYTGKAALVLKEKGCPNAQTAHKLLYQSYPKKEGGFIHIPRKTISNYKLIVVDEVSMLPNEMWELLLSHKIHVIALGDPGQLPPVSGECEILKNPHIFLDEIMRQAQESEIIRLTMDIREGKPLQLYSGKEVQIIDKKDVVSGMFLWADKIICAKNQTRNKINDLVRQYKFNAKNREPVEGDEVICLRNYWQEPSESGDVLVNGLVGTISNIRYFKNEMIADFTPDGNEKFDYFENLKVDYNLLTKGEETLVNNKNKKILPLKQFDYGYCITAWKAQGSEYDNVLVFEEDFPFNKEDHIKYLYTACTRSRKKLVIVRK